MDWIGTKSRRVRHGREDHEDHRVLCGQGVQHRHCKKKGKSRVGQAIDWVEEEMEEREMETRNRRLGEKRHGFDRRGIDGFGDGTRERMKGTPK